MDEGIVRRFMSLFRGLDRAYGTHGKPVESDAKGGKLEITTTAKTLRAPVTEELFDKHLEGIKPLGIIPATEEGTCWWGCIDVDDYDVDHAKLVEDLARLNAPLTVIRTKSGGAHCLLFMEDATSCKDVVNYLKAVAAAIGHGRSEIFPKQLQVDADGGLGSWLNMPYYRAHDTERFAIVKGGRGLTLDEFLDHAEKSRVGELPKPPGEKQKKARTLNSHNHNGGGGDDDDGGEGDFGGAPPCLQNLISSGFPAGTRNNGLIALGVFAKKKFPDVWISKLHEWNVKYMEPPLTSEEVEQSVKSLKKHEYNYRCNDVPITSFCNAGVCRTRQYGVGGADAIPLEIGNLRYTNSSPSVWYIDVDRKTIAFDDPGDLISLPRFRRKALSSAHVLLPNMKTKDWESLLSRLMAEAVAIDVPEEASFSGQFRSLMEDFLQIEATDTSIDDVLIGRPHREGGEYVFRLQDFEHFIQDHGLKTLSRPAICKAITDLGGTDHRMRIRGKPTSVWKVPDIFDGTTEPDQAPNVKGSPF